MLSSLTVYIQGETDWLCFMITQDLEAFVDHKLDPGFIGAKVGSILDSGDLINPLQDYKRTKVEGLLAKYIANTATYQVIKTIEGPITLFLTVFRLVDRNRRGYRIRILSILRGNIPSMSIDGTPALPGKLPVPDNLAGYAILLKTIADNPDDRKPRYDPKSVYYLILKQAQDIHGVGSES